MNITHPKSMKGEIQEYNGDGVLIEKYDYGKQKLSSGHLSLKKITTVNDIEAIIQSDYIRFRIQYIYLKES